jgi:hypothetical protein
MTKAEIILQTLSAMNLNSPKDEPLFSDEPEEEEFIVSILQDRLPAYPDIDIKTCEDFRHLNVECRETCHNFYPHYEMKVIQLPHGSPAWVCDTAEWAIYPERYQALQVEPYFARGQTAEENLRRGHRGLGRLPSTRCLPLLDGRCCVRLPSPSRNRRAAPCARCPREAGGTVTTSGPLVLPVMIGLFAIVSWAKPVKRAVQPECFLQLRLRRAQPKCNLPLIRNSTPR